MSMERTLPSTDAITMVQLSPGANHDSSLSDAAPVRLAHPSLQARHRRFRVGTSDKIPDRATVMADVFPESVEQTDMRIKTAVARAMARPDRLELTLFTGQIRTGTQKPLPWRRRSN